METRHTKVVEAIAALGTVRAASESLGYTQSALTKIVKRIEDEVGAPLFDRHPRGMWLNEYGAAFLEHATAIDREMRDGQAKIQALRSGDIGQVVLGAAPTWTTQILPGALAALAQARPRLKFRVIEGHAAHLERSLIEGRIDLGVSALSQPEAAGVVVEKISDIEFRLIVSRQHPVAGLPRIRARDLMDYRWVLAEGDVRTALHLDRSFSAQGLEWRGPHIEILSRHALLEIVANTDMIAFLPHVHGGPANPGVTSLRCDELHWMLPAGVMFRESRPLGPGGTLLLEAVKTFFNEQPW